MPNAYVTLDVLKGTAGLDITGTAYDSRLLNLIEHISRQVDKYCNRSFYFYLETKTFNGDGSKELFVPDLINLTSLKEDSNQDGTFDTTWAAADYNLVPYNAAPTKEWGFPYTRLEVNTKSNGSQDVFLKDQQNYEIVGTWGYRRVTKDSGINISGTLNSTATSLVMDGSGSGTIEAGMVLVLEQEQVYIPAQAIVGTSVAIERAKNGSTAAAHSTSDINIVEYPGAVVEATFIQTSRLWKRKDSGFASEVGFPETGQVMTFRGALDQDVKALLSPFKKLPLGFPI